MTFQDCLSFSPFEVIWQRLEVLYPDDKGHKGAYEKVYNNMLEIEPVHSDYRIRIDHVEKDEYSYWDVHGVNNTRHCDIPKDEGGLPVEHPCANELVTYAIEYQPRNKWAGMVIDGDTVCNMATIDIAVHCLWEMTFAGFEENDVQRQMKDIKERAEESKNANMDDYVEVSEGVMCHKDMVERMQRIFDLVEGGDDEGE